MDPMQGMFVCACVYWYNSYCPDVVFVCVCVCVCLSDLIMEVLYITMCAL